jgi:hypothetical protein
MTFSLKAMLKAARLAGEAPENRSRSGDRMCNRTSLSRTLRDANIYFALAVVFR